MSGHLLDQDPESIPRVLGAWLSDRDEPRYRAQQILEHLFAGRILDPGEMQNLPRDLRQALAESLLPELLVETTEQVSTDGTRKYRFELADGQRIESVWIPSGERGTLCISSQAGCPAKCSFCATGAGGYFRNLSPAEIVAQWAFVARKHSVTQIVFMGMGEPLLNYDALAGALRLLTQRFRFSSRRITVSTVGIPRGMKALARDFPQVRLALSLHSAVDETRNEIVPVNRKHSVAVLRRTLQELGDIRRVSIEYVLLGGVNASEKEAKALARFARGTVGHINLLPFHPFPGAPHTALDPTEMRRFKKQLESAYDGAVTIRKSRGLDIAGACGQLALLEGSGGQGTASDSS